MLHDYQLTARMTGDWSAAEDIAFFCIATGGKLKIVAWSSESPMVGPVVVTIHKNNVTTGHTFSIPSITNFDTDQGRHVIPPLELIDVEQGDLITLVSDGGADGNNNVHFHLTIEGVPPYNIAPVYVRGRRAGTDTPSFPGAAWKSGYLTGFFWCLNSDKTTATATLTIRKNGVSIGQTFTIPVGTAGDGTTGKGFVEFPSNIDALFFAEGDTLDITSDAAGANGDFEGHAILRAVGDHREFVLPIFSIGLGTGTNAEAVCPRPGRFKRIFFAANTNHTGTTVITLEREGVVIAGLQSFGALTAPDVGGGDRLPPFEGLPNSGLEFEGGDSINIISDGGGGNGEGHYYAVFEELAENLPI